MTRVPFRIPSSTARARCYVNDARHFAFSVVLAAMMLIGCNLTATSVNDPVSSGNQVSDTDVFLVVSEMPQPEGGLTAIMNRLKYPDIARKAGVEGKVFVEFVVDERGYVTEAEVNRSAGPELDKEALRVVRETRFSPGKQDGKAVAVRMVLPIQFKLRAAEEDAPTGPPRPAAPSVPSASSEVYSEVEQLPELIGGLQGLLAKIKYPEIARKAGVEGKVFVEFVVDERGVVTEAKIVKSLGAELDEEALRVVRASKFKPGRNDGKAVSVRLTQRIEFRLSN